MAERELRDYRRKRHFEETPEPTGDVTGADGDADRPRFVIQEHHATRLHWDLRLERDGVLASWAIPNGLPDAPKDNRKAVHTEDHPLEYLEFHGDIPRGNYGAGSMTIWDQGTYELLKWDERKVEVDLRGERARGRYALFHTGAGAKDSLTHRSDALPRAAGEQPAPR